MTGGVEGIRFRREFGRLTWISASFLVSLSDIAVPGARGIQILNTPITRLQSFEIQT